MRLPVAEYERADGMCAARTLVIMAAKTGALAKRVALLFRDVFQIRHFCLQRTPS
jgi:hypothetical protein